VGLLRALFHYLNAVVPLVESIATISAIVAGLWWFYKRREKAPRANIEHKVTFIDLGNKTTYVGIHVVIHNTGNVIIKPKITDDTTSVVTIEELKPYLTAHVESQKFSPEYKMNFIGGRTFPPSVCVEPGEIQSILFEFIVQNTTKAIKVYSHLDNDYNDGVGWDNTTTHEVVYEP